MSDQPGQKTVVREGPLLGSQSKPAGVPMPKGLRRRQTAIMLIDVSGSMENGKIDEANAAAIELKQKLSEPESNGAFSIAVISYAETVRVLIAPKPATLVDDREIAASVLNEFTNITAGLTEALKLVEAPPVEFGNWLRPIVVLLTDGAHTTGPHPGPMATTLKTKADVLCVGFGSDAKMEELRAIATSPQHAFHCKDGPVLRRFFATIGATLSRSIQGNQNAAALLGGIARG